MVYDAMIEAPAYFVAGVGGVGKEECLANANLIAAAPELLETLERLYKKAQWMNDWQHAGNKIEAEDWGDLYEICQIEARAAIVKAKGGA